ncbi:hypothetical protein K5V21_16035 [Clostridium sardiniense]|uniref:Uncharacterized protein n=1 Tax=Clostridium sardiniense TaxID=29369 RepID=A0ABS7L1J4_CLOSR|nr:hypothetical protein [Clostridium sardiniense]MBY0756931.1 hypothetical protein [Clostridium sardiniense]MBY0756955.1 hypothetical protein [Clostridium sardiniense]MDQ0460349.1 DNA-directed RNA polymerase specialized sigma subunit [Clostridium sardiniense]
MKSTDLFKRIERALIEYNNLSYRIEFLNKEIDIVKANKYSKEEELLNLNNDLNKAIRLKNMLDICIDSLNGVDKKVIELRYLSKEKLTWKQIASIVSYSECHCMKRIKPRAIKKMVSILDNTKIDIDSLM